MGKNFRSWHATVADCRDAVALFTQSVPILAPTGVNKRLFYDIALRFRYTAVIKLSCLRLLVTYIGS